MGHGRRNEFRSWLQSLRDNIESAISDAENDSPDILSADSEEIGELIANEGWTLYDLSYEIEEHEWREIGENNGWSRGGVDLDDIADLDQAKHALRAGIGYLASGQHWNALVSAATQNLSQDEITHAVRNLASRAGLQIEEPKPPEPKKTPQEFYDSLTNEEKTALVAHAFASLLRK